VLITRDHLEESLALIRAMRTDEGGIHGPTSKAWELQRESVIFIGGGRAALLQLAHPFVAHGVDQHSKTRTDVAGRFQRTFANVFAMTFGDLRSAFRSARRVHNVHTRIKGVIEEDVGAFVRGTPYQANESGALLWVHATLIDTVVQVYELLVRRLDEAEKDVYYQQTKMFARLFGIPEAEIPANWPAFRAYMDGMFESDEITVGTPAREMSEFLFEPARPSMAPVMRWVHLVTAGLLPPRIRDQFGMRFGLRDRIAFRASIAALRSFYALTPGPIRYLPAYAEACARVSGEEPSRITAVMDRLGRIAQARALAPTRGAH
jgi:uncharacterized protein (DUF2236 family)